MDVGGRVQTCYFCRSEFTDKCDYLEHVKEHLQQCRNINSKLTGGKNGGEEATADTHRRPADENRPVGRQHRVKKLTKRRKKVRERCVLAQQPTLHSAASDRLPCHDDSAGAGSLSDEDCLGDSESSDSDAGDSTGFWSVRAKRQPDVSTETATDRPSPSALARSRLSLAERQLDNNETEELMCLTCLKKFSNCQNLRRHLRLHISRDSIVPDNDNSSLEGGGGGKYICDYCPERFENKAAARVHEKTHKDQDPKCYICDKSYADRYTLRYHLRTHGIGLQIRCEYCNKSFPKPSRLESHVNAHHKNIRNFQCSKCSKSFKTRLHLENHFLQHSGERPHTCSECGITFRHKISLVTHQRSHGDIRPYCCETCGKTFREPSTLKAHMRVHSGDKPYKCSLCDKAFTQRAGLNYHKSVHAGLKPFKCDKCDYSTAKHASLVGHLKSMHNKAKQLEAAGGKEPVLGSIEDGAEGLGQMGEGNAEADNGNGYQQQQYNRGLLLAKNIPLPSPPLQQGDAVFAPSLHQEQAPTEDTDLSADSLPSFNILKSYVPGGGSAGFGGLMKEGGMVEMGQEGEQQRGGGYEDTQAQHHEERFSPYSRESDHTMSPPITPPATDYSSRGEPEQVYSAANSNNSNTRRENYEGQHQAFHKSFQNYFYGQGSHHVESFPQASYRDCPEFYTGRDLGSSNQRLPRQQEFGPHQKQAYPRQGGEEGYSQEQQQAGYPRNNPDSYVGRQGYHGQYLQYRGSYGRQNFQCPDYQYYYLDKGLPGRSGYADKTVSLVQDQLGHFEKAVGSPEPGQMQQYQVNKVVGLQHYGGYQTPQYCI